MSLEFYKEHIDKEQSALYFHFWLVDQKTLLHSFLELVVTQSYEVFYKHQNKDFDFVADGFTFESRHDTGYRSLQPLTRLDWKYSLLCEKPASFVKKIRVLTEPVDKDGYKRKLVMLKEVTA